MCRKSGFNLTKFISNFKRVPHSIPEKDRIVAIRNSDSLGNLPEERALGVL